MAHALVAHREERRLLGIDFSADVPAGSTISSVDEFIIMSHTTGADVTTQFRGVTPEPFAISGLIVSFWKEIAATAADQVPGRYRIRCRPNVSTGEKPIALDVDYTLIDLRIVGD